jgi:hypothetical protein
MTLSRIDLDGAGSPTALVTQILKLEPGLKIPVPIEDIAAQLDIEEISEVTTDGFEGGLVTDAGRSRGFILVNRAALRGRRRFTIGHELGHFLMTHHKPPPDGFRCSREDMQRLPAADQNALVKMEVEANTFSGLLIMPPPLVRRFLECWRTADVAHVLAVARHFDVSKEVAARSYAQYHDQPIAMIVVKDCKILRLYRNPSFPMLGVRAGDPVPKFTLYGRAGHRLNEPSEVCEARADAWLQSDFGKRLPELSEQVYLQRDGYALIMLWAEIAEEEEDCDPEAERTAKQRYQDRQSRWRT